jgi:hypothetical protein
MRLAPPRARGGAPADRDHAALKINRRHSVGGPIVRSYGVPNWDEIFGGKKGSSKKSTASTAAKKSAKRPAKRASKKK